MKIGGMDEVIISTQMEKYLTAFGMQDIKTDLDKSFSLMAIFSKALGSTANEMDFLHSLIRMEKSTRANLDLASDRETGPGYKLLLYFT